MRALVPVAALAVPHDRALVAPPRTEPAHGAAPQQSTPLLAPALEARPIVPSTPAPVPLQSTPVPSAGGGDSGDSPISSGGGED
jgi:hypothetical protein